MAEAQGQQPVVQIVADEKNRKKSNSSGGTAVRVVVWIIVVIVVILLALFISAWIAGFSSVFHIPIPFVQGGKGDMITWIAGQI